MVASIIRDPKDGSRNWVLGSGIEVLPTDECEFLSKGQRGGKFY